MAAPPPSSSSSISRSLTSMSAPSGSASISRSSSRPVSSVSSQSRSRTVSSASSVSSRTVSSSASIPPSSPSSSAFSTVVVVPGPSPHNDGPPQTNNMAIIVPIAAIACGIIIIYFAHRLYLSHKRRKDDQTPLPPPRTPAILEQGRHSVMYTNPQAAPASLSYRNSIRPQSMIYAPSYSNTSLASKGQYTSGSGNSTPTHGPHYTDESGRFSPLPPPSIRGHSRPHSVASFTSARQSMYGAPTLRGPSYLNRVEIVLPQPLAAQVYTPPSGAAPRQRHSMYDPELRRSIISPLSAAALTPPPPSPPPSSNGASRDEDWTERVSNAGDAESTSTCKPNQIPPPPPKSNVPTYSSQLRGFTPSPSLDLHVPGAFPPSIRGRSMSPPEPLLSSNAFVGSTSGSGSTESDEDRTPRK